MQPKPIPPEVRELFDYLMTYAHTGDLGVISVLDKETGATRFALFGRHSTGPEDYALVPLGFLSTTAGDEVFPPGEEPVRIIVLDVALQREDETDLDRWADDGGIPL